MIKEDQEILELAQKRLNTLSFANKWNNIDGYKTGFVAGYKEREGNIENIISDIKSRMDSLQTSADNAIENKKLQKASMINQQIIGMILALDIVEDYSD